MSQPKEHKPRVRVRGAGFLWGFVLALPLAAALIVFVAQNTQQVTVRWTVWRVDTSLVVVVLVTIFAAVLLAELVGFVWRHRRRRLLARAEALHAEVSRRDAAVETPAPPTADADRPAAPAPPTGEGEDAPADESAGETQPPS